MKSSPKPPAERGPFVVVMTQQTILGPVNWFLRAGRFTTKRDLADEFPTVELAQSYLADARRDHVQGSHRATVARASMFPRLPTAEEGESPSEGFSDDP